MSESDPDTMKRNEKITVIPHQIKQSQRYSNQAFRLTTQKHKAVLAKMDKILGAWNSLSFFFMLERNNRLAADILAECYCSAIGGTISALNGYYRAGFFYLRDTIELTKAAIYTREQNLQTLDYLPSSKKLGPVIQNCYFIKKYNEWCNAERQGEWHTKRILDYAETVINKHAIHLGSEALSWQKSIPSYSRNEFCIFAGAFDDMGRVLILLWILYDIETYADIKAGNLIASLWWVLYPFHRRYLKSEYQDICNSTGTKKIGVFGWVRD